MAYSLGEASERSGSGKQDTVVHLTTLEDIDHGEDIPSEIRKSDGLNLSKAQFFTIFVTLCLTLSIK